MPFGGEGPYENPVGLYTYEGHMDTVEYIWVNIEKLQDALPLHRVDQLVRSAKTEILFYLSEPGIKHILNDIIL